MILVTVFVSRLTFTPTIVVVVVVVVVIALIVIKSRVSVSTGSADVVPDVCGYGCLRYVPFTDSLRPVLIMFSLPTPDTV